MPTSGAVRDHPAQRATIWSWASTPRRSAPVAATSAMAIAIAVSSVHSPGAQLHPPPPRIVTGASSGSGGPNS
ncbi:MAG TPA: hypothetical protein VIL16_10865 [Trebonia sp.]